MNDRPAKYVNNYDGDSVTMQLGQGFYDQKIVNLRLAQVWAPETNQEGGTDVKYFVQDWFMRYMAKAIYKWPFIVITYETGSGNYLKTFDRFVANVISKHDGASLNSDVMKYIVDNNYTGGTGAPVRSS